MEGLTVQGRRRGDWEDVVKDVSLFIRPAEVLGLVGESGSGKSTIAYALFGYARPGMRITGGHLRIAGHDVLGLSKPALRRFRGRELAMVPQNPGTSMTPSIRVGRQIAELLRVHDVCTSAKGAQARTLELLDEVGLPDPAMLARRYPHQLSGGQLQRVAIALALACEPGLLVLDEPTTALDVTTQAKVLRVLARAKATHGVAMLYVTHDLGVLGQMCDRVAVMYAGQIVEVASTAGLFRQPAHRYTRTLIGSLPGFEHLDPADADGSRVGVAAADQGGVRA